MSNSQALKATLAFFRIAKAWITTEVTVNKSLLINIQHIYSSEEQKKKAKDFDQRNTYNRILVGVWVIIIIVEQVDPPYLLTFYEGY